MILGPEQYGKVSTYDLLRAAERGMVGIDHRFLHALVDDPGRSLPDLVRFGLEEREDAREDLSEDLLRIFLHLRRPEALPFLVQYLRRNHLDATVPLISALRDIGAPAVDPLLEFYKDFERDEESDAAFVLGSLGVRDPRILEALTARLALDPVEAGHCLAAYGDPAALPAMRAALSGMEGKEDWMRQSLDSSIHELASGPPPAEPDDEDAFDLWELYPPEADPRFDLLTEAETELFLDSPDADNRFAAVSVLAEPETPKRLWERLLRMAREDSDTRVRGECWQALLEAWETPRFREAIRACVADESASLEERSGALISMAARDGGSDEAQRYMLAFYEHPESRAKAMAAMAISMQPDFADYFRKHLEDPDLDVCLQAILGVATLELTAEAPRLVPYFNDEDLRSEALPCYAMSAAFELSTAGLRRLFRKIDDLAGGLTSEEELSVKDALNTRASRYELDPVYGEEGEELIAAPAAAKAKAGRNDPCPCGSGKKYKKCCGG